MVKYGIILLFLSMQVSFAATGDSKATNEVSSAQQTIIKKQLTSSIGLEVLSVKNSPMDGLLELITEQGLFYTSPDGKFLMQGKLYGLGETVVNHSEKSLARVRIEGLGKFEDAMIVFPAKNEKHVITVFTDITCGYCRKMHEQMDEYNEKGITVRYMAYPRSGIKDQMGQLAQGFKDLRSIWCHEDPQKALTNAKAGSPVAQRICEKPIADEFNFGRQIGVNSTPAIIFPNGMLIPGYKDPNGLIEILDTIAAES